MKLERSMAYWGTGSFESALKSEIEAIPVVELPLQQALTRTSYVSDSGIKAVVLDIRDTGTIVQVVAGIFFSGIDAGSCCADDPSSAQELTEYCELQFDIDKETSEAGIGLKE